MSKFPKQPTLLVRTLDDPPFLEGIVGECRALGWRVINLDYIDVHSSFTFGPAYPALWLTRKEVSLRSAMRGK